MIQFKSSILEMQPSDIIKHRDFAKDNQVYEFITISSKSGFFTAPLIPLVQALIKYHGSLEETKLIHPHLFEPYLISLQQQQRVPWHLRDCEFRFYGEGDFNFEVINNFYNKHRVQNIHLHHSLGTIKVNLIIDKGQVTTIEFLEPKEQEMDKDLVIAIKDQIMKFRHISDYFTWPWEPEIYRHKDFKLLYFRP